MRRPASLAWLVPIVLTLSLVGCGGTPPKGEPTAVTQAVAQNPAVKLGEPEPPRAEAAKPAEWAPAAPEPSRQDRYDAALLEAVGLIAEKKYDEALAALETAKAAQETEQIKLEIEKLKRVMEVQAAAEKTAGDIQAILDDGRGEEAALLCVTALKQYGGTEASVTLAKLKRQADALISAQLTDNRARQTRFRLEAEAAFKDNNRRAAVIAFEQALTFGEDESLRKQLDDLKATLARYDENRQRAAELRRDSATLEDALASLQEAAKAWDTLQVRQEIDEVTLALQKRRERLSVADFEVRGDIGMADAGRTLAEELLPAFKSRFDLVERAQVGKIIAELKLEASDLAANEAGRQEVGKLAKVRYLVLGSVTRTSGLLAQARLVDVRTGLVVQTAKVVAPTPDELLTVLPQLASVLMMSDDEKIAWERKQAELAKAAVQPVVVQQLPPPPEVPAAEQPLPPPVVVFTPRPPEVGVIKFEDFQALPPPPPPGRPLPPPVVIVERERPVKQKLFHVAIELGDNLFKRGRYQEAHAQFQLALNMEPDREEVAVRIARCKPHLPPPPPPPPVVVVLPPPPPPRPRLAVINFVELGAPAVIPPGLGAWTADNIAPYFCPPYDVVDRGEVFWYMGRLGMTVRDVLTDPSARRWLGRALGVRFFLLGSLRQTASFDADTHLVDAEYGFEVGAGHIHVHNPAELKLRLCELARLTLMSPEERAIYFRQEEETQGLIVQARECNNRGEFSLSIGFFQKALNNRPGSVEIQVLIQSTNERARQAELEAARRREWERQQAIAAEMQRQQWELARAAEAARLRAEQEAAALAEAERIRRARQREAAHTQLFVQADVAFKQNNFQLSIQLYESALQMKPSDEGYRQLALVRAKQQEITKRRAAEQRAAQETALRQQRDAEIQALRAQVIAERERVQAAEAARQKNQESRDQAEYARLIDLGQRQMAQQKYDDAVASFQGARQLRKTDEAERLVSQALVEQARATAEKKGAREKADLERRLAQEKALREKAEAEAKKNQELYTAALKLAQDALAQKKYDNAITHYHEAEKFYRTDVVLTGLRQAEEGRSRSLAEAESAKRKQAEEEKKGAAFQQKMREGDAALGAKRFDEAVKAYTEAGKLQPGNVDALAGLSKAEQQKEQATVRARREKEEKEKQGAFNTLLASGKANIASKQYDAAVAALQEAVKLNPASAEAKAALQEAEKGKAQSVRDVAEEAAKRKRADEFQKRMGEGRAALGAKQYDAAIKAFKEAQQVMPGDQSAAAFIKEAEKGKSDAAQAVAAEARKKQEEQKRTAEVQKALSQGRAALANRDLDGAEKSFKAAAQLEPANPEVVKAQQDLQTARNVARAEAEGKQKKLAQFQAEMKKGRDALTAGRHDEAIAAFGDASKTMPDDPTAKDMLQKAQKAKADALAATEAAKKKQQEDARKQAEEAQRAKAAEEAAARKKAADEAARKQAVEAERAKAAAEAAAKKRTADYQEAMKAGRTALTQKRYDDAIQAARQAQQLVPNDRDADALAREAEAAKTAARAADDVARKKAEEEQKRKADYTRLMAQGQTAMTAKHYDEAVKAYSEALRLMPNDPEATKALQGAQKALEAARTPARPTPPVPPKADPPATPKVDPKPPMPQPRIDPKPQAPPAATPPRTESRPQTPPTPPTPRTEPKPQPPMTPTTPTNAEFARHMAEGKKAMDARRFPEAVKAYEAALKVSPGNPEATAALKKAKEAR